MERERERERYHVHTIVLRFHFCLLIFNMGLRFYYTLCGLPFFLLFDLFLSERGVLPAEGFLV